MPLLRPIALFSSFLLAALLLAGLGCAGGGAEKPAASPSPGLERIARTGRVRIGTTGEQPPLSMTSRSGELLGLDIALSRVLARSMGVEAEFVKLPFGELLDALADHELEMVMSGVTITPARSERVTFVGPYFTSGKTILTRSPELAAIEIAADLNRPELRLAALAGSTSESFVAESMPSATLVPIASLDEAIQRVIAGAVDALVADRETGHFAVLRNPDAGLLTSKMPFTVEPMGIAVPLDDPRFARLVQIYLNAVEDSGVLEQARQFWFRDPSWVGELR